MFRVQHAPYVTSSGAQPDVSAQNKVHIGYTRWCLSRTLDHRWAWLGHALNFLCAVAFSLFVWRAEAQLERPGVDPTWSLTAYGLWWAAIGVACAVDWVAYQSLFAVAARVLQPPSPGLP